MNCQEKVLCHRYNPNIKINNGITTFIISMLTSENFCLMQSHSYCQLYQPLYRIHPYGKRNCSVIYEWA